MIEISIDKSGNGHEITIEITIQKFIKLEHVGFKYNFIDFGRVGRD